MGNSASFHKRNSAQKAPSWYVGRKRGYHGAWGLGDFEEASHRRWFIILLGASHGWFVLLVLVLKDPKSEREQNFETHYGSV